MSCIAEPARKLIATFTLGAKYMGHEHVHLCTECYRFSDPLILITFLRFKGKMLLPVSYICFYFLFFCDLRQFHGINMEIIEGGVNQT